MASGASLLNTLSVRSELAEKYAQFEQAIWQQNVVPQRVLELCHCRIEQIHGVGRAGAALSREDREAVAEQAYQAFNAAERAALVVAEHMPYNHHGVSDSMVADLRERFDAAGTVTLLTALGLFDATARAAVAFNAHEVKS